MYYGYGFDTTYLLVIIGAVLCLVASAHVKSTYRKYAGIRSASGITGAQAAEWSICRTRPITPLQ